MDQYRRFAPQRGSPAREIGALQAVLEKKNLIIIDCTIIFFHRILLSFLPLAHEIIAPLKNNTMGQCPVNYSTMRAQFSFNIFFWAAFLFTRNFEWGRIDLLCTYFLSSVLKKKSWKLKTLCMARWKRIFAFGCRPTILLLFRKIQSRVGVLRCKYHVLYSDFFLGRKNIIVFFD